MSKPDNNIVPLPSAEQIETEAATWLTVLGREDVSPETLADFRRWRLQSERHDAAYLALSALWRDLGDLKQLRDIDETPTSDAGYKIGLVDTVFAHGRFAAAACALFVVGAIIMVIAQQRNFVQKDVFATIVGQQSTVELSDGSTVQLNTSSRVEVDFSKSSRIVRLIDGEAYFAVAKDAARPFYVYADDAVVQAIGTAFTVRLRAEDDVEVIVEEGKVAFASHSVLGVEASGKIADDSDVSDSTPPARLSAGQTARFNHGVEEVTSVSANELNRKLAWRNGMVAYSGESLSYVVADIGRYTDIMIEITDPVLRDRRVAGYFRVGDVEALLDTLEINFDVRVDRLSDSHVRLSQGS